MWRCCANATADAIYWGIRVAFSFIGDLCRFSFEFRCRLLILPEKKKLMKAFWEKSFAEIDSRHRNIPFPTLIDGRPMIRNESSFDGQNMTSRRRQKWTSMDVQNWNNLESSRGMLTSCWSFVSFETMRSVIKTVNHRLCKSRDYFSWTYEYVNLTLISSFEPWNVCWKVLFSTDLLPKWTPTKLD